MGRIQVFNLRFVTRLGQSTIYFQVTINVMFSKQAQHCTANIIYNWGIYIKTRSNKFS